VLTVAAAYAHLARLLPIVARKYPGLISPAEAREQAAEYRRLAAAEDRAARRRRSVA